MRIFSNNKRMDYIRDMTKDDFLKIEDFGDDRLFDAMVIVPTGEIHDSGFECLKFILFRGEELVGATHGYSDVLFLNGIGGFGKDFEAAMRTRMVPVTSWRVDCLPGSGCLRLFTDNLCDMGGFVGSAAEIFDTYIKKRR